MTGAAYEQTPDGFRHLFDGRPTREVRVRRTGADYIVEAAPEGEDSWVQLRIARLHADDGAGPVLAGLYACSPKDAGYEARFEHLRITRA